MWAYKRYGFVVHGLVFKVVLGVVHGLVLGDCFLFFKVLRVQVPLRPLLQRCAHFEQ